MHDHPNDPALGPEDRATVTDRVALELTINGTDTRFTVEPRVLLVQLLREECGLTGTKIGCDTSSCGACTVLVDGHASKSCTLLASQVQGSTIETIEHLEQDGELHPMQRAFHEHHALQCGFCTPGMIMAAISLVRHSGELDANTIRTGLKGNVCRCTGYQKIVEAVLSVAPELERER